MIELAEAIVIAAIAATFFSDVLLRSIKMMRTARRSNIQVADAAHSAT